LFWRNLVHPLPHWFKVKTTRRHLIFAVTFAVALLMPSIPAALAQPEKAATRPSTPEHVRPKERITPQSLPGFLEEVRKNYGLPSLGVAVLRNDKISVVTVGVRKVGDPAPVTNDDGWHIGSCTKSMTATLMAMLVEEGKLSWDSTLPEMLPDLAEVMLPAYRGVTMRQLLAHRAGFPTQLVPTGTTYKEWISKKEPLTEQRIAYVKTCLVQEPAYPPGTKMLYSNVGYVIAGQIAERLTGQSWEELMKKRLFEPLEMSSVTYGTQTTDKPLEPWPHSEKEGQAVVTLPGLDMELPLVAAPAGLVRCSLTDWGKYAKFWLHGVKGESDLIAPETFHLMLTPPDTHKESGTEAGDSYALGWNEAKRSWSQGTVFYHSGSNLKNHSTIWLAPQENFAVMIVTNRGSSSLALDDVAAALVLELSRLSKS
jgi:CubicO group peptidase (beta-lactamase class C family)